MPLDHVTLPTRRFTETVEFLERVLEFPKLDAPDGLPMRSAWFDVGNNQAIHILEADGAQPALEDREFGRHVALCFPHARWLRIRSRLEHAGIEIIEPIRKSKTSRFFVSDPNGYCFEIVRR